MRFAVVRGIYSCTHFYGSAALRARQMRRMHGQVMRMGMELSAGWQQALQVAAAREDLAICNEATAAYGLSLTEEQMTGIVERRREALRATGRVEFGRGALRDIVTTFRDSPYLHQETYEETLVDLQDAFYRFKEEAEVEGGIADEELLSALRVAFDERVHGSTDALEGIKLAELRVQAERERAGEYDGTTQREAAEEEQADDEDDERPHDELDRVYDEDRLERPDNDYAAGFYDGYNELYRVGFDTNSRIGGSTLSR